MKLHPEQLIHTVRYEAGHDRTILSVQRNFLKDDRGDATPKKIPKIAKLADHNGVLHTSWGDLNYTNATTTLYGMRRTMAQ
jgi:hypothetical protein